MTKKNPLKKYAIFGGLGGILLILFVNLAGWSFYDVLQSLSIDVITDLFGVTDELHQKLVIAFGFLAIALILAAALGKNKDKIIADFLK